MKFFNKNIWFLVLLIGGFGLLAISSDFNFLNLVGSLNNSLILDVSNGAVDAGSFGMAIFMEAFCSIHMSVFVLIPLSKMISKDNDKKVFIILFLIRVVILLIGDLVSPMTMALVDFFSVFVGAFLVVPISAAVTGTKINHRSNQVIEDDELADEEISDSKLVKELATTGVSDPDVLKKALVMQYADINRAFYTWDTKKLKDLCSYDVYMQYKMLRELYEDTGETPKIEDVDFYEVNLISCKKHGNEIFAELIIKYTCIEFVIDQNNNITRGSLDEYKDYTKKLSFSKRVSDSVVMKCPNCGASVANDCEACDYCKTELNFKIGDWVLNKETLVYEGIKGKRV